MINQIDRQKQSLGIPEFEKNLDSPFLNNSTNNNPTISISEIKARRFYIIDRAQMKTKKAIQKEKKDLIKNKKIKITQNHNIFYEILNSIYPDFSIEKNYMTQEDKIVIQKELYLIYKILKERKNIKFPISFNCYDLGPYSETAKKYIEEIYGKNKIKEVQQNIQYAKKVLGYKKYLKKEVYDGIQEFKILQKFIKKNFSNIPRPLILCAMTHLIYEISNTSSFINGEIFNIQFKKWKNSTYNNFCKYYITPEDISESEIFFCIKKAFMLSKFLLQNVDVEYINKHFFDIYHKYQDIENITIL